MEKSLEALHREYQLLSSRISRFCLLGLLLLVLATSAVSRADREMNAQEVKRLISEINALRRLSGREPSLSYVFQVSLEPGSASAEQTVSEKEKKAAAARQEKLEATLDAQADEWFTIEASILGTNLEFDTRYWITLLPIGFWAWGSYLYILLYKRSLIRRIAAHLLATGKAEEITALDRLMFTDSRGPSSYLRFPLQLEGWIYAASMGGLSLYLATIAWRFHVLLDEIMVVVLAEVVVSVSCWVVLYCLRTRSLLEKQSESLFAIQRPSGLFRRLGQSFSRFGTTFQQWFRRRPGHALFLGSGMILLSLVLATTLSCNDLGSFDPASGYDFVQDGGEEILWPTVVFLPLGDTPESIIAALVRADWVLYLLAVGLAFLVLSLIVASLKFQVWKNRKLVSWLAMPAGATVIYFLSDFFFQFTLAFVEIESFVFLHGVAWLLPVGLWWRYRFSKRAEPRSRWKRLRRILLILYVPGSLASFAGFFWLFTLPGLAVFLAGLILLAWSCAELASACEFPLPSVRLEESRNEAVTEVISP